MFPDSFKKEKCKKEILYSKLFKERSSFVFLIIMAEKIKDPLLLGSTAIMNLGGILSSIAAAFFFKSMMAYWIIIVVILLVDALILYRCVTSVANNKIVDVQ